MPGWAARVMLEETAQESSLHATWVSEPQEPVKAIKTVSKEVAAPQAATVRFSGMPLWVYLNQTSAAIGAQAPRG